LPERELVVPKDTLLQVEAEGTKESLLEAEAGGTKGQLAGGGGCEENWGRVKEEEEGRVKKNKTFA
jgi:hypothetical protein